MEMFTKETLLYNRVCKSIKIICNELNIDICDNINLIDKVSYCFWEISKKEGQKRNKIKIALVIMLIYYISDKKYCYKELSRLSKVQPKHIVKSDDLILSLIREEFTPLLEYKNNILKNKTPIEYILYYLEKNNILVEEFIVDKVKDLVQQIEKDNNCFLLNKSPISLGAGCLYYILNLIGTEISIKDYSQIFNISTVTITKILNSLQENYKLIQI